MARWRAELLALALLAGCSRGASGGPPPPEAVYALRCASCHGSQGRGDGPTAAAMAPPPRDLTDPAWHDRTDDARLRKVIINGGLGVGLSPRMPGNPDLIDHPDQLDALIRYVRGLRRR